MGCNDVSTTVASTDFCVATSDSDVQIPKIIHHIWHDWTLGKNPNPPAHYQAFREQLKKLHPESDGWVHMFWNNESSLAFMKQHYPEYVAMYQSYDKPIKRADALRYFLLHHFGGVYLDLGFAPIKPIDPLLNNCGVVLFEQSTEPVFAKGRINNAAMASLPGHKLFQNIIEALPARSAKYVLDATGPRLITEKSLEYMLKFPGTIKLYDKKFLYPFDWEPKNRGMQRVCRDSTEACRLLFPEAYMVKHWGKSWLQHEEAVRNPFFVPQGLDPQVDKFFVINLDKSPERLAAMRKQFDENRIEFERFPAVYGKELPLSEKQEVYRYDPRYLKAVLSDGEIGNYYSHYKVLKEIEDRNYKVAAVIEDDIVLHKNRFSRRLKSLLAHAPANWDLIYLGCHANEGTPASKDHMRWGARVTRLDSCSPSRLPKVAGGRMIKLDNKCLAGNYGYLVSAQGARKLVKNLLPMSMPTDYAWKDLFVGGEFGEFNAYCANPELVSANYTLESTIDENGRLRQNSPSPGLK